MRTSLGLKWVLLVLLGLILAGGNVFAAEAVIETETVKGVVVAKEIVKTADNFIVLFDSSSSMKYPYKNTGLTMLEAARQLVKEKNEMLPDLGYMGGLYLYTPFKPVYPMQVYDKDKFTQAIGELPSEARGPTLLQEGLRKLDDILAGLSGRTVVYLLTNGYYSDIPGSRKPSDIARNLADKYNVCFYVISYAEGSREKEIMKAVASINACSRVIAFDDVFAKPVYIAGALFVVNTKAVPTVITLERLADLKVSNVQFDFDSAEIHPDFKDELDILGTFLQNNSKTYVVLTGFTDDTGPMEYNLGLSRRRADSVEAYLVSNFNISVGRIVTQWYGPVNPISFFKTSAGRQQNRRVEFVVMGFD